jgi:hypothetical protein
VTSGPLTRDDLTAEWRSVTDESYWRPFAENPNTTREVHDQMLTQMERASAAIDRTTQSSYIFPWSGQTADPATGDKQAFVWLRCTRTKMIDRFLVHRAGTIVRHVSDDYGPDGAVGYPTGRNYVTMYSMAWLPGQTELWLPATAERPGSGYNAPLPGTIKRWAQVGTGITNTGRAVGIRTRFCTSTGTGPQLDPIHIGGYLLFDSGPMSGSLRQVIATVGGDPMVVDLDRYQVLRGTYGVNRFRYAEQVYQYHVTTHALTGLGSVIASDDNRVAIDVVPGYSFNVANGSIVGTASETIFTPDSVEQTFAVVGDNHWRFLDWIDDLGISVANVESPIGGQSPVLDEIGFERNVPRSSLESDDSYRVRVGNPADVISPNAIRRAANHVLATYALGCCFRQVGTDLLPGFFYDAGSSANAPQRPKTLFAYDMPVIGHPQNRNKVYFDLDHFRGWFKVGIPPLNLGAFGFAYDAGLGPYDAALSKANFYDGGAPGNKSVWAAVWAAVERARMAGVLWDLYIEDVGCF